MDDFEYSVHISEQDWDSFFLECEDCAILSPVLASREDSGMSDIDDMGCNFLDRTTLPDSTPILPEADVQIDGPPDCEGSPVDNYLSKYGIRSPEQVLSGSEEDLHLQTVNLFFERLKSVTEDEQTLEQSHVVNRGREKTGHLEGLIDKQDSLPVDICPSGRNEANLKGEITKQGAANTWGNVDFKNPIEPTKAQKNASTFSDIKLVIEEESLSLPLITVGKKKEEEGRSSELHKEEDLAPESKPPDIGKMPNIVVVNRLDVTDPNTARENIAQLDTKSSSDRKDLPVSQITASPSNLRRKRRKKKRMSIEPVEAGHGAHFQVHQSESEDERFIHREEINSLCVKTEPRIKTPAVPLATDTTDNVAGHLQIGSTSEALSELKSSKSLPVSFTSDLSSACPKHVRSTSMNDISCFNNGQLKTKACELSLSPRINITTQDNVLNSQACAMASNMTEPLQSDSAIPIREAKCSPAECRSGEILAEPLSDNSDAGYQRKSLLSPNISSAANPTEPLSSLVSFNLTEARQDLSCLTHEIDCSTFKTDVTLPGKENMVGTLETKKSSLPLTGNVNEMESCLEANSPNTSFQQDNLQEMKIFTFMDVPESESSSAFQTAETILNVPLSKTNSKTECHMPDDGVISDHGKDGNNAPSTNNSAAVLNLNAFPIRTENATDESDGKGDIINEAGVSLCIKPTGSSECMIVSGHKEGLTMLSEDSSQNTDVLSFSSPESESKVEQPESVPLDAVGPCPVFAISSFWNEMEKLTINDILRLRLIGNPQHPSVLNQPDDSNIADTTDAADSGYFTQPDDSKPDRLSGDMSFISDLDEDLAQLQSRCSSKQEDESCDFPSSSSLMWENDPDPVVLDEDIVVLNSETALPESLYTAQQCFRKMCKNVSVQNLQALDSQPIRQMRRNASLHSIHSEVEDNFIDPFYHIDTSVSKNLSDDEETETSGITLSEIIQFFFGKDEPERCASRTDNVAASYLDEQDDSVPEMYDHFFSEFDSGSFFYPLVEDLGGNKDKMVPIFSCSRSANRNFEFPEAYDYFFADSPVSSDEDDENDNAPIKVVTRYDNKSAKDNSVAQPDIYEHFYTEGSFQNILWTNPLSLRRMRRSGLTVPAEDSSSWALTPVRSIPNGNHITNVTGPDQKPFPDLSLLSLESCIIRQLAEQQKKCFEMQTPVTDPRLDAPFLPLKQADMCLICIAFASWVLKSTTSSGADTWKAALLANVSALSAIRYLRRHKREEATGKTPLRQIEPA